MFWAFGKRTLVVVMLAFGAAWAQSPAAADADPLPGMNATELAAEELNLGWAVGQTFVVLALVVGLAWLTLNVGLRRLLGIRAPAAGASLVTVLERVTLDQKRALFVVQAGGEVLLIGGGEGALQLISKLDKNEVEKLRAERSSSGAMSPFLQKLLGKQAPPTPEPTPKSEKEESS